MFKTTFYDSIDSEVQGNGLFNNFIKPSDLIDCQKNHPPLAQNGKNLYITIVII